MPNEPKPVKNAAKNLGHAIKNWGKTKKKKASNAIKRVRFTNGKPGRNPVKANTGTKKKGFNNTKFRNEKKSKLDKLKKHIKYCKNLEKAYKEKHREVQTLTDYLKYLVNNTPNKPISETDVIKIMDGIGNIKIPDNVDEKQKRLDKLKVKQKSWKNEFEKNIKPAIKRKLTELSKPTTTEEITEKKINFQEK